MFKRLSLFLLLIITCTMLFSFDWGIKYGAGLSENYGDNSAYNLLYNLTVVTNDTIFTNAGSLNHVANHRKSGLAHNAGLFFVLPLTGDVNEFQIQTEITWQRYNFSSKFERVYPMPSGGILAAAFPDFVNGSVCSTIDYVTVPFLFRMQQDKPAFQDTNEAIVGYFGYVGPSVSYMFNHEITNKDGIKELDDAIKKLVADSETDFVTNQNYTYTKYENSTDKIKKIKYDMVFGFGWNLQNVLKIGLKRDAFVLDARFNLNLNQIGDADINNSYKLISGIVSLGYKL